MRNADQNHDIEMPVNAYNYQSIPINQNWSELIDIGINATILIGIGQ